MPKKPDEPATVNVRFYIDRELYNEFINIVNTLKPNYGNPSRCAHGAKSQALNQAIEMWVKQHHWIQ